jgi:hypothetical protein
VVQPQMLRSTWLVILGAVARPTGSPKGVPRGRQIRRHLLACSCAESAGRSCCCGVDDVSIVLLVEGSRLRQRLRMPRSSQSDYSMLLHSILLNPQTSIETSHRCLVCACPAISRKQAHTLITALRQSLYLALPHHEVDDGA